MLKHIVNLHEKLFAYLDHKHSSAFLGCARNKKQSRSVVPNHLFIGRRYDDGMQAYPHDNFGIVYLNHFHFLMLRYIFGGQVARFTLLLILLISCNLLWFDHVPSDLPENSLAARFFISGRQRGGLSHDHQRTKPEFEAHFSHSPCRPGPAV